MAARRIAIGLGVVVFLALLAATFIVIYARRSIPYAQVRFLVRSEVPSVLEQQPSTPEDSAAYRATQIAMLRSPRVINNAVQSPAVRGGGLLNQKDDPVQWVLDHLETEFDGDSEVLLVRVASEELTPPQLITLTDAVADAYLEIVVASERNQRNRRKDMLDRTHLSLRQQLVGLREQLAEIHTVPSDSIDDWRASEYADIVERRRHWLLKKQTAELELTLVQANNDGEPGEAPVEGASRLQTQVEFADAKLAEIERERQQLVAGTVAGTTYNESEAASLEAEIDFTEQFANEVAGKLERMGIELSSGARRIEMLERAVYAKPSSGLWSFEK